jgi:microcystin-dependent protein
LADLDFPASPIDGQTYNNYTYVASKSVWQSIPGLPAGVPAGTIMGWGGSTAPDQWIICDGTAVSRSTYSALYAAIGTTYGVGNGTTTFNLPDLRGRVPVGSQSAITLAGNPTITTATPAVVTLANHGLATGQLVYFTTTGALPTGLTANTRYWVNVLTSSTFRLSTSLANALAGTSIATTVNGSGTHTVYSVDFELGGYNGEKTHKQTETELVSHTHSNADGNAANFISAGGIDYGVQYSANLTGATGGSLPSNIMQPYGVINYIIKYTAAYVPQESELVPRINALETGGTNYIINGAFDIWQRGTSFSNPVTGTFSSDRWRAGFDGSGVTRTVSQQAFALGSAPAAGYEGEYFYRYAQTVAGTSATFSNVLEQPIEDVRTLSGQTITVSFWAKADATRTVRPIFTQYFGTGGSPSSTTTTSGTLQTLTTSWARYTSTVTLPSMSGKTIGTGNNDCLILTIQSLTINATQTIDIWGVQVEAGSYATSFKRNASNIQAELAACQRYYITGSMGNTYYIGSGNGTGVGTHGFSFAPMRVAPTATVLTFTNSDNASNGGISVFSNSAVNGNFRNSNTAFPYYSFTATFKLEAEL